MSIKEFFLKLIDPCPKKCLYNGYGRGCSYCTEDDIEPIQYGNTIDISYKKYLEDIMERNIEFYDYKKLDKGSWNTYYADATAIINNETFNNELNNYKTDLVKFIALESKDWDQVMNLRTAIITLETFKERLEAIENPLKVTNKEDVFNAI